MRRFATSLLSALSLATASLALATPATAKQEIWYLNGSELRWSSYGGLRQVIKYKEPMQSDAARGALNGAVLFRGWRIGRRLVGRARMFKSGCRRPFRYKVRGWISPDGRRAVLHGARPVIVDCRVIDYAPYGRKSTIRLTRDFVDGSGGYHAF